MRFLYVFRWSCLTSLPRYPVLLDGRVRGPRLGVLCLFYNLRPFTSSPPPLQKANSACQWLRVNTSHSLGRRLWREEHCAGRTFITTPGPGRILIFLVCQESLGLTWGHASDEGRTGKKVLWGMTSCGCIEACKHLMIPCHGYIIGLLVTEVNFGRETKLLLILYLF